MKKIGVAGLQREQIKKTIETAAPGCCEIRATGLLHRRV